MKNFAESSRKGSKPNKYTSKKIFHKRKKRGKVRIEISKRAAYLMAMLFMVAAAVGRLGQYMTNIDLESGMFVSPYEIVSVYRGVMYAGCAIVALLVILGREGDKIIKTCILINPYRLRSAKLANRHPKKAGVAAMLMGIAVIAETILSAGDIIKAYRTDDGITFDAVGYYRIAMTGVLLISVFVFFSVSNSVLSDKGITPTQAGSMCIPAVYKCMEALYIFTDKTIPDLKSENILMVVLYASSAVFFLSFARLFLGFEKSNTRMIYMMTGYTASIMAAASVLPRIAMYFISSQPELILRPQPTDFVMLLLPFTFLDVFWGAYEYVAMPRLNPTGRKWVPAKKQTVTAKKKII